MEFSSQRSSDMVSRCGFWLCAIADFALLRDFSAYFQSDCSKFNVLAPHCVMLTSDVFASMRHTYKCSHSMSRGYCVWCTAT